MSTESVLYSCADGVAKITINREAKLNALNAEVISNLGSAFTKAGSDPQVRAVILTGAGERAFVAGADIVELQNLDGDSTGQLTSNGHELMNRISNLGKPVIAAIGGFALGGGCELALACTIRIASDKALLGLPEVKLGLMPGYGGTQRLTRLVGSGRALHLMLTGDPVNAAQALEIGLVSQVVEHEQLAAEVEKLAASLAASAPLAIAGIIAAVNQGADLSLAQGLEIESEQFAVLSSSEDMLEGTNAFLEKRRARFTGS